MTSDVTFDSDELSELSGTSLSILAVRQAFAWRTALAAEHDVSALERQGLEIGYGATHFLPANAGVAVTLETPDGSLHVLGAADPEHVAWAVDRHRSRCAGRLFRFPGQDELIGVMTIADLVDRSAVDRVVMVGSRDAVPAQTTINTQSFVRPELTDGAVVLLVRPAADGRVVPFEQPHPTPCCANHG